MWYTHELKMGSFLSSGVPRVVYIEGNIGVGKSSLLDELERRGYVVVREDVENWDFLSLRYQCPKRWMFALQIEIASSLQNKLKQALQTVPDGTVIFVERSLDSSLLFSEVAYNNGALTEQELKLFKTLCCRSIAQLESLKSATVYMECHVNICLERIEKRQRSSEPNKITTEYLHMLKIAMDEQFTNADLKIDGNCEIKQNASFIEHMFCI